jgi:ubiquinone/menaquinone biosynthesis C-methylase UbiE
MLEDRKQKEIEFHSRREHDRLSMSQDEFLQKYSNKKFYFVTRRSRQAIADWIAANCRGRLALDYCAGLGGTTLEFAAHGGRAVGIDISHRELKTAQSAAAERGETARATFVGMDAEQLAFAKGTFDLVVCNGVLHHLDLDRAYAEIARVLKPDGKVLCIEALGHNPAIMLYRRFTPHLRTAWESEHILRLRDVKRAKEYFRSVEVRYFHLATIGAVLFRGTSLFEPALTMLEGIDRVLLRVPGVRLMAWMMNFELRDPRDVGERVTR